MDQTLTASTSDIDDSDGLTNVSYSYQWTAGGSDINGATGSTLTLTYNEQGQTIQVRVTFTDDADNEETLTQRGYRCRCGGAQPRGHRPSPHQRHAAGRRDVDGLNVAHRRPGWADQRVLPLPVDRRGVGHR